MHCERTCSWVGVPTRPSAPSRRAAGQQLLQSCKGGASWGSLPHLSNLFAVTSLLQPSTIAYPLNFVQVAARARSCCLLRRSLCAVAALARCRGPQCSRSRRSLRPATSGGSCRASSARGVPSRGGRPGSRLNTAGFYQGGSVLLRSFTNRPELLSRCWRWRALDTRHFPFSDLLRPRSPQPAKLWNGGEYYSLLVSVWAV